MRKWDRRRGRQGGRTLPLRGRPRASLASYRRAKALNPRSPLFR
jgi:hypothetical protein